mgnify:CR=1 FL=1
MAIHLTRHESIIGKSKEEIRTILGEGLTSLYPAKQLSKGEMIFQLDLSNIAYLEVRFDEENICKETLLIHYD